MKQKTTTDKLIAKPSFAEAFRFWLKLGFISFGGPAGQIAIMHQSLVDEKKWISDSRFLHGLNYCMLLPGPEAQQLATYIGWLLHGIRGGVVAGLLFILPSILILLGLSAGYVLYGNIGWVASLFYGLKPAVIAIVVVALFKVGKRALLSPFHYCVAAGSFIAIFFFNISFPLIILVSIIVGFLAQQFLPGQFHQGKSNPASNDLESSYYLNANSPPITEGISVRAVVTKMLAGIFLWIAPVTTFMLVATDIDFWLQLISFFTKAAFVTFGGAYAVLPYVAQESVEKFHWLTQLQMVDGLALGETTPGPLIMVLTFVGFMAGFHESNGSILAGSIGLVTTAFYTFLPSFLFILIGAPFVEMTKENKKLKSVLAITTAAVVGVILNLTIYLAKAVFLNGDHHSIDWLAVAWTCISFLALFRFKINMMIWIGISAIAGLLHFAFMS